MLSEMEFMLLIWHNSTHPFSWAACTPRRPWRSPDARPACCTRWTRRQRGCWSWWACRTFARWRATPSSRRERCTGHLEREWNKYLHQACSMYMKLQGSAKKLVSQVPYAASYVELSQSESRFSGSREPLMVKSSEQPILVSVSVSVRISASGLVSVSVSVDPTDTSSTFTSKRM